MALLALCKSRGSTIEYCSLKERQGEVYLLFGFLFLGMFFLLLFDVRSWFGFQAIKDHDSIIRVLSGKSLSF